MAAKKRIFSDVFDAIIPLLDTSEERIAAARLVLVDGWSYKATGDKYGWSKQNVQYIVDQVYRVYENFLKAQRNLEDKTLSSLPTGWERVEISAPGDLLAKFAKQVSKARLAEARGMSNI
jgi:hypothetical protein